MTHILSIDPGLDATGWALFALGQRRAPWLVASELDKVRTLTTHGLIRTASDRELPHRCGVLWSEIRHVCLEHDVRLAFVEKPAIAGTYSRHRKGARGDAGQMIAAPMLGFHAACGAIYAGLAAAGVRVIERPAAKLKKPMKRAYVNRWLAEAGHAQLKNQDIADAVFVGLSAPWEVAA